MHRRTRPRIIDDRASNGSAGPIREASPWSLQASGNPRTGSTHATGTDPITVTATKSHPITGLRVSDKSTKWKVHETIRVGYSPGIVDLFDHYLLEVFDLMHRDIRRWELAREALNRYHLQKANSNLDLVDIPPISEYMSSVNHSTIEPKLLAFLGFTFVAACYGGLHALAWIAQFPTSIDQALWRGSAIEIASPAAIAMVIAAPWYLLLWLYLKIRGCCAEDVPSTNPKITVKETSPSKNNITVKNTFKSALHVLDRIGIIMATFTVMLVYIQALLSRL